MKLVNDFSQQKIGGKAYNLYKMKEQGLNVPAFSVFSFDVFTSDTKQFLKEQQDAFTDQSTLSELSQKLQNYMTKEMTTESFQPILDFQQSAKGLYAVRSSANREDGVATSFAGQFATQLYVEPAQLISAIQATLLSLYTPAALSYYFEHQIPLAEIELTVILQEMIDGELSGVYFTANPQGILNEHLVVIGEGVGSGVVEDRVETTMVTIHPEEQLSYFETNGESPIISNTQQNALEKMAEQVVAIFGERLDIEFTFFQEELYVLQARPITTIRNQPLIILDNSNIVESYPGTTTPLTFSFIQEAYGSIFRGLAKRMLGKDQETLDLFEPTFQNMIAQVNSRVFYQINNWYRLLQLLPFSKKIIPIWQDMLGVQVKEFSTEKVKISFWSRTKIMGRIIQTFLQAPKKMKQLEEDFSSIDRRFQQNFSKEANFYELYQLFEEIKKEVLEQWDITLVNDLYAFVFTGLLKKMTSTDVQAEIAGIEQIESMKPVIALEEIRSAIKEDFAYQKEIETLTLATTDEFLASNSHPITSMILTFIQKYGDRAPEELKLETETFHSQPFTLIQLLQQQLTLPVKETSSTSKEMKKGNFLVNYLKKQAMMGIKYRESSRLNRTRIYGMMRLIFLTMGAKLQENQVIEQKEDVFYLKMNELFALVMDTKEKNIQETINYRKQKRFIDQQLPAFSRWIFVGKIIEKHPQNINKQSFDKLATKEIQGIGCSQGVVRGEILVVEDIQQVAIQESYDKIIVTRMTDPGWVYLLTQAKGIIAEKGSLLSHTAIISRELGIPSVVNVSQATSQFQTGDWVTIDGQTGIIRREE